MKKRIWELDALRGLCILGMVAVHFIYDLKELYHIIDWEYPSLFAFVKQWGGVLFLLISGISATLGSRSVRRGILVLLCGMVVSAVTYGMYHYGFADEGIIIYFGVLQCLGICMLLWATYKNMPWWALLVHGVILVALGLYILQLQSDFSLICREKWLMPLGIRWTGFASSDYFPLLPNLGFFLIGAAIGRTAYRKKESLLPKVNPRNIIIRFLSLCGRQSLWIYMLHQPVLNGLCYLITLL